MRLFFIDVWLILMFIGKVCVFVVGVVEWGIRVGL